MALCCIIYHAYSFAEIKTIFSLKQAQSTLEHLDSNALVVFDVDETLIISIDKIRRRHPENIINQFTQVHFDNLIKDVAHKEYLDSIRLKMSAQKLVDLESPHLINKLQAKNIRVIALTHMRAGSYYTIESMEEWRYKQLYDLGIDLSVHNPNNIILKNLPMGQKSHPVFHKGILATSRSCSKGQALAELLKQLNWIPSSITFFDDYEEHANFVNEEMEKLNIPCISFHNRATEMINSIIDIELALFQYQYLIKHEKWLSDIQARELMNKA